MRSSFVLLILLPLIGLAQVGGINSFNSLNLVNNARAGGIGGSAVSFIDGDLTQFIDNPATLDSVKVSSASFMINPYFADINFYASSASFNAAGQKIAIGINYLNYGDFDMTDATGVDLGTFQANDYQVVLGTSHRLGPIAMGVNAKFIGLTLETYNASAIAFDLGGTFAIKPNWSVGMVFENFGFVLSEFTNAKHELPFDVKIGTTFKPAHMPFRFTITSNSITNTNVIEEESDGEGRSNSFLEDALRSVTIGTELVFSDNFQVLVGYNHKRKQELRLDETGGGAGFSYGFLLRINRFNFRFSRMTYHTAGGTSLISVQTNFNDFKKIL